MDYITDQIAHGVPWAIVVDCALILFGLAFLKHVVGLSLDALSREMLREFGALAKQIDSQPALNALTVIILSVLLVIFASPISKELREIGTILHRGAEDAEQTSGLVIYGFSVIAGVGLISILLGRTNR